MNSRDRFYSMPEEGMKGLLQESEVLEELILGLCKVSPYDRQGAIC